jgi:hypothetical protein
VKLVITALCLFVSSLVHARTDNPFRLEFDYTRPAVIYYAAQWAYVAREPGYNMHMATPYRLEGNTWDVHTMLIYYEPKQFNYIAGKTKKIYTYGTINCDTRHLLLRNEFWVDDNETIIFDYDYSSELALVDLTEPGSVRNAVLLEVCK